MQARVRHEESLQCRQRIPGVPLCIPGPHNIPVSFVNGEGRYQREIQINQLLQHSIPFRTAGRRCLLPEPPGLAKPPLLIGVVIIYRIILNRAVCEQRLWQTIPVSMLSSPIRALSSTLVE